MRNGHGANTTDKQVVVITGASAGVGRATALEFARRGVSLGLLARNGDRLNTLVDEVEQLGCRALALVADVADADAVEAAAQRCEAELGPISVWVNCAMVTVFSPSDKMNNDEYRRVTEVNYLGTVYGTLAALRRMRPRNHGIIVQCGSALSYRGIPLQSAYCGSKFAVRGFTDAVRSELLHEKSKVRITMVQLSAFNTPQFQWARSRMKSPPQPLPPIFQPELAARALVHAAYHYRREWNVGFPAVKTIVGTTLFPALADYLAARQAWKGQMDTSTDDPTAHTPNDNLYHSVNGDFGSHGRFDDKARANSWQWWISVYRSPLAVGLGVGLAALLLTTARAAKRQGPRHVHSHR